MDVTTLVVSAAMRCVWSTLVGLALEMQPTHKHARVSMAIISMRGHAGGPFFQSSSSL